MKKILRPGGQSVTRGRRKRKSVGISTESPERITDVLLFFRAFDFFPLFFPVVYYDSHLPASRAFPFGSHGGQVGGFHGALE